MVKYQKRYSMANKKFYYRNKNKHSNKTESANIAKERTENYSQKQLALSLSQMGICESTSELLSKNGISTAADLVRRTEKDMYRVQGLNKKILFEVKEALKANGMDLRNSEDKAESGKKVKDNQQSNKQDKSQPSDAKKSQKTVTVTEKNDSQEKKASKFGLVDRKSQPKQQNKPSKQEKSLDKQPVKPSGPAEWRKVMKGGKWGYSDGVRIVIPTVYDEIFAFKEGVASVEIDEKCGYIDENNEIVVPLDYETAMSFSQGVAMVVKGGKCGYINKNNEVIIPFEYDAATPFENGEAKVKKDGKWGTLTLDNKVVWI